MSHRGKMVGNLGHPVYELYFNKFLSSLGITNGWENTVKEGRNFAVDTSILINSKFLKQINEDILNKEEFREFRDFIQSKSEGDKWWVLDWTITRKIDHLVNSLSKFEGKPGKLQKYYQNDENRFLSIGNYQPFFYGAEGIDTSLRRASQYFNEKSLEAGKEFQISMNFNYITLGSIMALLNFGSKYADGSPNIWYHKIVDLNLQIGNALNGRPRESKLALRNLMELYSEANRELRLIGTDIGWCSLNSINVPFDDPLF